MKTASSRTRRPTATRRARKTPPVAPMRGAAPAMPVARSLEAELCDYLFRRHLR